MNNKQINLLNFMIKLKWQFFTPIIVNYFCSSNPQSKNFLIHVYDENSYSFVQIL